MNADGGGKTFLTATAGWAGHARPSRQLHGGKRWFLEQQIVQGEAGPGELASRHELFAVREDGVSVRLTNAPEADFGNGWYWDWCPDESASGATIAGTARRWTGTSSTDTVIVGSAGVYAAHVSFDGAGNVAGLDVQPSFLVSVRVAAAGYGAFAMTWR